MQLIKNSHRIRTEVADVMFADGKISLDILADERVYYMVHNSVHGNHIRQIRVHPCLTGLKTLVFL